MQMGDELRERGNKDLIKNRLITLSLGIGAIVLVFGIFGGVSYFVHQKTNTEAPIVQIEPDLNKEKISEIKNQTRGDFEKYLQYTKVDIYSNGLVTPTSLTQACKDKGGNKENCNREIAQITKTLSTNGEIENAYLYLKVGVSREDLPLGQLTQFDSVWFFVNESNYSGQLLRPKAIINKQSDEGVTELLYSLKEVPFTHLPYNDGAVPDKIANILDDQLNKPGKQFIGAFVSTLGYGKILEMKIGYNGGSIVLR